MASKKETFLWRVGHPEHTDAMVIAPNWEQATVEAAKWWDVPWGKVVAMCECKEKGTLLHGVCCDCGQKMWSPGGAKVRCGKCESVAKSMEESRKARNRRFYAEMHKK